MSEFENEYTWGKAVVNNSTEKFHTDFDHAVDKVRDEFDETYPMIINGKEVHYDDCFEVRSPCYTEIIVAKFPKISEEDTQNAISSARNSFEKWRDVTYQKKS